MSKFIGPPWLVSADVFPSARSLTSAARSLSRLLECLDPLANLRGGRGIQLEFEQPPVGVARHSRLAEGVRGLGERGELRLAEEAVCLSELELAEMPERCNVLRPQAHVLGPGGDRLVDLAVLLEGVRELAPRDRAERALLNLFLGG